MVKRRYWTCGDCGFTGPDDTGQMHYVDCEFVDGDIDLLTERNRENDEMEEWGVK